MTALTNDAPPTVDHPIGATGQVAIQTAWTEIRIRGVDGDAARAWLVGGDLYGTFHVTPSAGRLEIRPIRRLTLGRRADTGPLVLEVPRGSSVRAESASGSILVLDVEGPGSYRTVSGDTDLAGVRGDVTTESVSGDIKIRASAPIRIATKTVSGDVDVVAPAAEHVEAKSMSGDLRLLGRLPGPGPYVFESVSGDVTLAPDGPLRLRMTTISGDLRSDVHGTSHGGFGRRSLEILRGGPMVDARTVSGDVRIIEHPTPANPSGEAPGDMTGMPPPPEPPEPPEAPAPPETTLARDDDRLAILRALEAGEIDVAEAERRLLEVDG